MLPILDEIVPLIFLEPKLIFVTEDDVQVTPVQGAQTAMLGKPLVQLQPVTVAVVEKVNPAAIAHMSVSCAVSRA